MGKPCCYLEFAVIILCIIWQLPKVVECAPALNENDQNCTECCSFMACMNFDSYTFNASTSFMDQLCSKLNIAIAPTCFTPSIVSDCVYVKRVVQAFPYQNQIGEGLKAACEQKKYFAEMQNISNCIIASGGGEKVLDRCTTPYMNSLKDPKADICEAMKTMSTCVLGVMTATNCTDSNSDFYRVAMKSQNKQIPLCGKTSNSSTYVHLNIGLHIVTLLLISFHINFF